MSIGLAFYILMLIWLVFGISSVWPKQGQPLNHAVVGGNLLLFILLLLIGWKVFGPPIHS